MHICVVTPPTLTIGYSQPFVMVTWSPTNAVLQQASALTGPWQSLTNVTSPYGFIPNSTSKALFFRANISLDAICIPPQ